MSRKTIPPWQEEFVHKAGESLPLLKQVRDIAEADARLERDLTRDELRSRLDLVTHLLSQTQDDVLNDALMVLDLGYAMCLDPWLHDLPQELAHAGLVDEAVNLGRRLAEVLDGDEFRADVARILAQAGRHYDARREVEGLMKGGCAGPLSLATAAEAMRGVGDKAKAQVLYRLAGALEDDPQQRRAYLEEEIPLLRALGRGSEAKALEAILPDLERSPFDGDEPPPEESWAWGGPELERKPGRNAPCPCSSGKKYKKCCGR